MGEPKLDESLSVSESKISVYKDQKEDLLDVAKSDSVSTSNEIKEVSLSNSSFTGSVDSVGSDGSSRAGSPELSRADSSQTILFMGDNVIVNNGSLLNKRNKQLRIKFDEETTHTFEYPSEEAMLAEPDSPEPQALVTPSPHHVEPDDEAPASNPTPASQLSARTQPLPSPIQPIKTTPSDPTSVMTEAGASPTQAKSGLMQAERQPCTTGIMNTNLIYQRKSKLNVRVLACGLLAGSSGECSCECD